MCIRAWARPPLNGEPPFRRRSMKLARIAALFAAATVVATPALAQTVDAPFDPREYQTQVHGRLTQVLVIGTPHLSGVPDDFDTAVLEPLLDRLAAFDPDVIAI